MPLRRFKPNLNASRERHNSDSQPPSSTPSQNCGPDPCSSSIDETSHPHGIVQTSVGGKIQWVKKKVAPRVVTGCQRKKERKPSQSDKSGQTYVEETNSSSTSQTVSQPVCPHPTVESVSSLEPELFLDLDSPIISDDNIHNIGNTITAISMPALEDDKTMETSPCPSPISTLAEATSLEATKDAEGDDRHCAITTNNIHEDIERDKNIHDSGNNIHDFTEHVLPPPPHDRGEKRPPSRTSKGKTIKKKGKSSPQTKGKITEDNHDDSRNEEQVGLTTGNELTPPAKRKKSLSPDKSQKQFLEAPDPSTMTMQDLIYYNPSANPMSTSKAASSTSNHSRSVTPIPAPPTLSQPSSLDQSMELGDVEDEGRIVPQLKIGADGSIQLDETSMLVETTQTPLQNISDTITEEGAEYTMSTSFRERHKIKKWTKDETTQFYKALSQVGTDFTMMTLILPKRTRKELKNKFKKEEKNNPLRISTALEKLCTTPLKTALTSS